MDEKIKKIIEEIESLSVLELNELIKALEEKFGTVSMPVFTAPVVTQETTEKPSVSSTVTVELIDAGENKIQVIKALREILPNLGLKEAKDMVDNVPKVIKENISQEEANKIKEKIESAGGKVSIK